jgi:acetyltransferase
MGAQDLSAGDQKILGPYQLKNGLKIKIRYITPEDEEKMISFHRSLSESSVYRRYFQLLPVTQRVQHSRLLKICSSSNPFNIALIAQSKDDIMGVGRLTRVENPKEAEFAIIIRDDFQRHGLGGELLRRLLQIGKTIQLEKIIGFIQQDN